MHNREKEWGTADGRRIPIREIEDSHLVNVINWIIDNQKAYSLATLDLMIAEAKYRQPFLFAEGKAYPQLVDKRWKLVDPKTGEGKIIPPPAEYIEAVKDNETYQRMFKRTQKKRKKDRVE